MTGETEERLRSAGMSRRSAARHAAQLAMLTASLRELGATAVDHAARYWVPGRIEVLGKHTDYAGGRSLLCAVERGFTMVAAPRSDALLRIVDVRPMELAESEIGPEMSAPARHWSTYPFTVARRMARDFPTLGSVRGADIVFSSDLPRAAGVSSSSALVVATFLALADVNDLSSLPEFVDHVGDNEHLAGYLGAVENGWSFGHLAGDTGVGTLGGSEDHTAILCGRPDELVQYTFRPVHFERAVPVPAGHSFAIGVSGVRAEKTGAARERYNRASRSMSVIAEIWRRATGRNEATAAAVIASSPMALDELRAVITSADTSETGLTPQQLLARLDHFVVESTELIPAASDALARHDLTAFGDIVDRSQARAERLLENQIDETVELARSARELGAVAASAFGAGFGGSVWALVRSDTADDFLRRWEQRHRKRFPAATPGDDESFFVTNAGPSAIRIE
ncbi:MAG TPA: galactokinase family protein [Gemmatimonadaceae bacterium]|nr:galactokinase family protein [Gemmatimonadaceae bacterium]